MITGLLKTFDFWHSNQASYKKVIHTPTMLIHITYPQIVHNSKVIHIVIHIHTCNFSLYHNTKQLSIKIKCYLKHPTTQTHILSYNQISQHQTSISLHPTRQKRSQQALFIHIQTTEIIQFAQYKYRFIVKYLQNSNNY